MRTPGHPGPALEERLGWYYDQTSAGTSSEHGNLVTYNVKDNQLAKNYPAM